MEADLKVKVTVFPYTVALGVSKEREVCLDFGFSKQGERAQSY